MRFVPIKSCEQQAVMSLHRVREGFKEERTACINRIRGVLAEHGLVFGKSPKVLRAVLTDVLEDAGNTMTGLARMVVQRAFDHWRELDEHMTWCDRQIGAHVRGSEDAKRAAKITGIGEIGASALIGAVGDFKQFKGVHQFGAWLGTRDRGSRAAISAPRPMAGSGQVGVSQVRPRDESNDPSCSNLHRAGGARSPGRVFTKTL